MLGVLGAVVQPLRAVVIVFCIGPWLSQQTSQHQSMADVESCFAVVSDHVLQQPRVRLRHLQSVTLRTFSPSEDLPRHCQLFYQLFRILPDGQQQMLYCSEKVRVEMTAAAAAVTPAEQVSPPRTSCSVSGFQ